MIVIKERLPALEVLVTRELLPGCCAVVAILNAFSTVASGNAGCRNRKPILILVAYGF